MVRDGRDGHANYLFKVVNSLASSKIGQQPTAWSLLADFIENIRSESVICASLTRQGPRPERTSFAIKILRPDLQLQHLQPESQISVSTYNFLSEPSKAWHRHTARTSSSSKSRSSVYGTTCRTNNIKLNADSQRSRYLRQWSGQAKLWCDHWKEIGSTVWVETSGCAHPLHQAKLPRRVQVTQQVDT